MREFWSTGGGRLYYQKKLSDDTYALRVELGTIKDSITLKPSIDYKEAYDSTPKFQKLAKKGIKKISVEVDFETYEVTAQNLAIALSAKETKISQPAETGIELTFDNVKQGTFVETDKKNITNVTVTNSDDSVTYVEGVDYTIKSNVGWIKILNGSINDGDTIKATFDTEAYEYWKLEAFKGQALEGIFEVVQDTQTENNYKYTFPYLYLELNGDIALLNQEDYATLKFKGSALSQNGDGDTLGDYVIVEEIS